MVGKDKKGRPLTSFGATKKAARGDKKGGSGRQKGEPSGRQKGGGSAGLLLLMVMSPIIPSLECHIFGLFL